MSESEISTNERAVNAIKHIMLCCSNGVLAIPDSLYDEMLKLPPVPEDLVKPLLELEISSSMGIRKKLKAIRVLTQVQRNLKKWELSVTKEAK
jgi:hypothetical protein